MRREEYFNLLKAWCDGMLKHQVRGTGNPRFDGGLMCPACQGMHGRSADGVYPLLAMADMTGEHKYLEGALLLFDWGENMVCDDGSLYNDSHSPWNGITVFTVMGLYDSLERHGHLLTEEQKARFEARMQAGAEWIYRNVTMSFRTNINYHATAAAAMALVGNYENREDYRQRARELAQSCVAHMVEGEGYLYGEGHPMEAVTARGCRPVDIGYNVEESVPSLLTYARAMEDEEVLDKVKKLLTEQLEYLLPDGAWDNSFGSRNFKWTYWGSRTSDGCQTAYGTWGDVEPLFAEAAYRNMKAFEAATYDGLLYGGPDYRVHGEAPCIHHTFCHANALAAVLDSEAAPLEGELTGGGQEASCVKKLTGSGQEASLDDKRTAGRSHPRVALPTETFQGIHYHPTTDLYRIAKGDFLADVTGYDFEYTPGGHASGGCITLLWNRSAGPICISSMTNYSTPEPHNMQLSVRKAAHQVLTPGVELRNDEGFYAQRFDYHSTIKAHESEEKLTLTVETTPEDMAHNKPNVPLTCHLTYEFTREKVKISGRLIGKERSKARFVLPTIGRECQGYERNGEEIIIPRETCQIRVAASHMEETPKSIFCLAGGFEAWKLVILPDEAGEFAVEIQVEAISETELEAGKE